MTPTINDSSPKFFVPSPLSPAPASVMRALNVVLTASVCFYLHFCITGVPMLKLDRDFNHFTKTLCTALRAEAGWTSCRTRYALRSTSKGGRGFYAVRLHLLQNPGGVVALVHRRDWAEFSPSVGHLVLSTNLPELNTKDTFLGIKVTWSHDSRLPAFSTHGCWNLIRYRGQ